MIRFFLTCLLLLTLRPSMAAASVCASDEEETHSFASADGDLGFGAVRSTNGLELLADLTVRVNSRISEGKPRARSKVHKRAPVGAEMLLSMRSRRLELVRELELPCGESPFVVYLPYHANPPPVLP